MIGPPSSNASSMASVAGKFVMVICCKINENYDCDLQTKTTFVTYKLKLRL